MDVRITCTENPEGLQEYRQLMNLTRCLLTADGRKKRGQKRTHKKSLVTQK